MTELLQLTVSGVSLGCMYALVALGFVVIMKANRVLSLFQGAMSLIAAYLAFQAAQTWDIPFVASVAAAVTICALLNALVEWQVMQRAKDGSELTLIFLTFGMLLAAQAVVEAIWGSDTLDLGDPWGLDRVDVYGVTLTARDLWTIGASLVVLVGVFVMFDRTKIGLAMRAAASDPEAATAQGISQRLAQGISWALAGALAGLAGILLATAVGGGVRPGLAEVAFAALPAIFLGGLGSPTGAILGGLILGLTQQWTAGYAPENLGQGFSTAFPYMVMVLVLIVRPQGILGQKTVRRA